MYVLRVYTQFSVWLFKLMNIDEMIYRKYTKKKLSPILGNTYIVYMQNVYSAVENSLLITIMKWKATWMKKDLLFFVMSKKTSYFFSYDVDVFWFHKNIFGVEQQQIIK